MNLFAVLCLFLAVLSFAQTKHKEEKEEAFSANFSELTPDQIRIYQYGEISKDSLVGGGLLGTVVGLGTGHIVYGEYSRKGWIFTVGEMSTLAIATGGLTAGVTGCFTASSDRCSSGIGLSLLGATAFFGLRLWEIIDVWTLPGNHNSEYRAIKEKVDAPVRRASRVGMILPIISPEHNQSTKWGLKFTMPF